MKKILIIVGASVLVFLLLVIAVPFLFKDQIKNAIDQQIAKSIAAEVSYDGIDLSLLKRFPNLSLSVESLTIIGQGQFEGDTLIFSEVLTVAASPIDAIFSEQLEIKSIDLIRPYVQIIVDQDGAANYDIAIEDQADQPEADSDYSFSINRWDVENGSIAYVDKQTGFSTHLEGIDHQGSGDFSKDQFDLETSSKLLIDDLSYQGISYLSQKQMSGDMTMEINLVDSKYTFKQNAININQLAIAFDGWVAMPENSDDINLDISISTPSNEFKDLLSLVPGMYVDGFENLEADGLVSIDGHFKGTYSTQQIPAFELALKVENGMFHYPELPSEVHNINMDLLVANSDGDVNSTLIDLSQLHIEFGESPLDGSIKIDGFSPSEIDAQLATSLDLAKLTSIVPMDDMELRGNYQLKLNAAGTYDSAAQVFPVMDARMSLENGYLKSSEFPESIEQINLITTVTNQSGSLPDTRIEISEFDFLMDGEPFAGYLTLVNPHDFAWDLDIEGGVDLAKADKILDLEGMDLQGRIKGQLASKGKVSSLEQERYIDIPTSGDFEVEEFVYHSQDLAHPFKISSGKAHFNPQQIVLTNVSSQTGSSDLTFNGELSNYLNYLFQDAPIKGTMNMDASNLNLNEWMEETDGADDSASLSVLEIPENIDFAISAQAGTVLYDNMTLKNARGEVRLRNGQAELKNLSFNALGGGFLVSGLYNPVNPKDPKFNMEVEMQQVGFKEAFNTFNTVKVFAPVAQLIQGKFSSNFELDGSLQPDMMPDLSSLSVAGLVNVLTANLSATDTKLVSGLAQLTQFNTAPTEIKLNDVVLVVQIKDGQMEVAPFTAYFGDYKTIVSGSTGIDGTLNFGLNMEVPAGVVGTSVNQAIAKLTGSDQPVDDKLNLNIELAGSYKQPKFSMGDLGAENTTTGLAKSAAVQKTNELKDSANQLADQEANRLTKSAKQELDSLLKDKVEDSTSAKIVKDAAEEILDKDKVKDVFNLFKKKKKSDSTETKE